MTTIAVCSGKGSPGATFLYAEGNGSIFIVGREVEREAWPPCPEEAGCE